MDAQTIPMEADESLEVRRTGGDLVVQGWDRSEMEARGDGVHCEQSEGTVTISSRGDLVLSIPRGVRLVISTVRGDVRLENLQGTIDLSVIGGDASLRNLAGAVSVNGRVGGETRFENVARISVAGRRRGPGADFPQHVYRVIQEAQRSAEQQHRRTQDRLRRAEKTLNRVRPVIGADFGRWLGRRRATPPAANLPNDRVPDEERMAILNMLHEKKITSEQADKLLQALDGDV